MVDGTVLHPGVAGMIGRRGMMAAATGGVLPLPSEGETQPAPAEPTMLLTVFLRHDQGRTLDEIQAHLRRTGWYRRFPPPGVEVLSWHIVMGIGQVVTLRLPPAKLRETNRTIEQCAWGAFRTEFYPTYDYKAAWEQERREAGG
jgi:hypothetical protein